MKSFYLQCLFSLMVLQPFSAPGTDLGSWNILNLKYRHSPKLSLFTETQLRSLKFYRHFHYYEFKGGITMQLHPGVNATFAAGSYQTYKEGGNFVHPQNNSEFRLWPQLALTQKVRRMVIEQRYRLEMRWTSNGYRNRFRYRVGASYSFGNQRNGYQPFQISGSNELFFTDREPYFERNRMQLGLQYKFSTHIGMQIGYLHQFDYKINDETGRDFLVVGYFLEF